MPDVTPQDALRIAHRILTRAVDGHAPVLSAEEGSALKASLWDAKRAQGRAEGLLALAKKREASLHAEADKLTAQIVTEEARAVEAEALAAMALGHLRRLVEAWSERRNYQRELQDAQTWLRNLDRGQP